MTTIQRLCGLSGSFIILLLFPSVSESQKLVFPKACIDCH